MKMLLHALNRVGSDRHGVPFSNPTARFLLSRYDDRWKWHDTIRIDLAKTRGHAQFCQQSDAEPDDAIYTKAVDKIGEQGVMDLIAVNGYYDVVSMTLNVARVAPPAGDEFPFKQAGR